MSDGKKMIERLDPYQPATKEDMVNHPPHYKRGGLEVIDIIEAFNLPYHLGNVIKYILRHDAKGKPTEDLEKALWYLNRYLEKK